MSHPLSEHFRWQSRIPSSPLSAALLAAAADDLDAGGPAADVMAPYQHDPPGSAPALRLLGALHRLVLERRAPALAMHYPSVGGTAPAQDAWPAARDLLSAERDVLTELASHPVQTNEVGRCSLLFGGLLIAGDRFGLPIRLLEIGSSGGLCLNVDRYGYEVDGRTLGEPASPVRLSAWTGLPPADLARPVRIVSRRGCDPAPVDTTTTAGRLTLTSYVWADVLDRLERLRGALAVAAAHPVTVERSAAAPWLARELARPQPGVVTVLWHSIVWQYIGAPEQAEIRRLIESAGGRAGAGAPLVELAFEPAAGNSGFALQMTTWPGGNTETLATAAPHGVPTSWR